MTPPFSLVINPNDKDNTLLHRAAANVNWRDFARCFSRKPADINVPNSEGQTPLMMLFGAVVGAASKGMAECLQQIDKYPHIDMDAVDKEGRNLAFYIMMPDEQGGVYASLLHALAWALKKGVNPLVPDKEGKTAIDRFIDKQNLATPAFLSVCKVLAKHGYSVPAMVRQHGLRGVLTEQDLKDWFAFERSVLSVKLREHDVLTRLFNPDGMPSELTLSACGYGVINVLFQSLQDSPQTGLKLYRLLEESLPEYCKDCLHTSVDLAPFLRAGQSSPASAVEKLLKRKSSALAGDRGELPGMK